MQTKDNDKSHAHVNFVVTWDDDDAPVARATVVVFDAATHRAAGEGKTDAKGAGDTKLSLDRDAHCESAVYFDVALGKGDHVLSTREMPIRLSARDTTVHLAVPHAHRPEVRERQKKPVIRIGEFDLDAAMFSKLDPSLVLELARAIVDREFEAKVRDRLVALCPEIVPSEHANRRLSNAAILELIEEIIRIKQWPRGLRLKIDEILRLRRRDTDWPDREPDIGGGSGFTEQVHLCPNFRITYQDSGPAAVNTSTAAEDVNDPGNPTPTVLATLPAGGAPAYIKRICFWLERALAAYVNPPFSLRNPAAGGRIEVVVNTGSFGSAGATTFFINNALPPDVLCAVAVHELFHMVHRLYTGSGAWLTATNEGGAVWAEDAAAEWMNRYLDEAGTNFNSSGYMVLPHSSLETFAYKASLFWRYVAEQQSPRINAGDEPTIGAEVFREILERCEAGSWSSDAIRTAIRNLPWYQDFYEFAYLDPARLDLTSAETALGNFAMAAYLKDIGTNVPDRRFDFMEDEENIAIDDVIVTMIPTTPLQTTLASVARTTGTLTSGAGVAFSNSVPRFGSRYYEVAINPGVTSVQVAFTAGSGLTSTVFQLALIDEDNQVREIYRTDRASYTKRFPNNRGGKRLNRVVAIVTGCASAGSFTLNMDPAVAAPDVMVTRWHSVMKNEYEVDSRNWAWTWVSPDIFVDSDLDGVADGAVFFGVDNKLHIRLHNKGNADASGIGVQFWYQDASGGLSDAGWLPVRNVALAIQSLSGLSLAQGASNTWRVDWSPVASGMSNHFCVRAVVTVPGDPNTDNKRVLSNFGNVRVPFGGFRDFRFIRRNIGKKKPEEVELLVVPRFGPEFDLATRDLREQRIKQLRPGQVDVDELRIYHRNVKGEVTATPLPKRTKRMQAECPCAAPLQQRAQLPDLSGHYAVDPETLPPGLKGQPMVTLVHRVDGQVIGGVTLLLTMEDREHATGA